MGGIGTVDPYGRPAPPPPPPQSPQRRPRPTGRPRPTYEAQRQRGRRTMLTWVIVVLLLAAVLGAAAWWFGSGRWTSVPQIGGKDPITAEHILQDSDLAAAIQQAHSDTVPAGQVISTDPSIGGRALRGSTITVVVSEGRPIVPDVTPGAQVQAAEQQVQQAQLTPRLDAAQDQYSPTVPKGAVVGLNPPAGTQVNIGANVVVIVSKGPPPNPVPNVVGQPHDQAFQALQQAGFQPYDEPKAFDPNTPGNNVIKTDPPAGTLPTTGGSLRVGVVVSNAVSVPSVQGMSGQQAQQTLQAAGLQVQVQSFGDPNGGQTFNESPAAGTIVQPGSTVMITVFP
jgi:eukaryotic-like serine/threonine-protein kinase